MSKLKEAMEWCIENIEPSDHRHLINDWIERDLRSQFLNRFEKHAQELGDVETTEVDGKTMLKLNTAQIAQATVPIMMSALAYGFAMQGNVGMIQTLVDTPEDEIKDDMERWTQIQGQLADAINQTIEFLFDFDGEYIREEMLPALEGAMTGFLQVDVLGSKGAGEVTGDIVSAGNSASQVAFIVGYKMSQYMAGEAAA